MSYFPLPIYLRDLNVEISFLKVLLFHCDKQDLESEQIQLDDDLRIILEHDGSKVEELMESNTSEIFTMVLAHEVPTSLDLQTSELAAYNVLIMALLFTFV